MKGPYGTAVNPPSFALPLAISATPTTDPTTEDTIRTNRTAVGPKNAPTAPISFTSPKPRASFLKTFENSHPMPHRKKNPNPNPATLQQRDGNHVRSICSSGISTEAGTPSSIPPMVTRSGR